MNHSTAITNDTKQTLGHRLFVSATALVLALIMLSGVGFIQGHNAAVHNAAHDTRHVMNFPCH